MPRTIWLITAPSHTALPAEHFGDVARLVEETLPGLLVAAGQFDTAVLPVRAASNADLADILARVTADPSTKGVILLVADEVDAGGVRVLAAPAALVPRIRRERKDIYVAMLMVTLGDRPPSLYGRGLLRQKQQSINLVLAHELVSGHSVVIGPEQTRYHEGGSFAEAARGFVEMIALRSGLTFTRATVVDGKPVDWNGPRVPFALRAVVNHCVAQDAYKPVNGTTVGHFAAKVGEGEFLTSRYKTDFNQLDQVGLVRVETVGTDRVIAHGAQPSVGGQSQRIVFQEHPDTDCIVHFHAPTRVGSPVPVQPQRPYECGSHECGQNTSNGLARFGDVYAVMLDGHGPNVVFHRDADPAAVIDFIEENFDLSSRPDGEVEFPAVV